MYEHIERNINRKHRDVIVMEHFNAPVGRGSDEKGIDKYELGKRIIREKMLSNLKKDPIASKLKILTLKEGLI